MIAKMNSIVEMHQQSGINKELTNEFKNILANKLIFTKFQPVVCLATGKNVGFVPLERTLYVNLFMMFAVDYERNHSQCAGQVS